MLRAGIGFTSGFVLKIFICRERGWEGDRKRNNVWLLHTHPVLGPWPTTQASVLTGNQTGHPVTRRLVPNPLCCTGQGRFISSFDDKVCLICVVF